jgi:AcrR family transcriptional regulator
MLSTATNLYKFRSIRASGVDAVATETRISKATLYKYSPSKIY